MVNTKILLSVVIVLLIGVAAASYQITTSTPGLWQPTTSQGQSEEQSTDQVTSTESGGSQSGTQGETTSTSGGSESESGDSSVKISASKAKSIVQNKYIEQPGATAGTPKLQTMNGKKVYVVPVIYKGEQAGEIWIDPETGDNIGGAGGAP